MEGVEGEREEERRAGGWGGERAEGDAATCISPPLDHHQPSTHNKTRTTTPTTKQNHTHHTNTNTINSYELLLPKRTSLRHRVPGADAPFLDFLAYLLTPDPARRPTAEEALRHPWLRAAYPSGGGDERPAED